MEPFTIAALASMGVSGIKSLLGAAQGFAASKKMKDLWRQREEYQRPEEINQMVDLYRQRAAISQLPGQDLMEAKLGRTTAKGIRQAERFAPSSTAALGAVQGLHEAEVGAIRDLGIEFARYKAAREAEYAAGLGTAAQYADEEFYYNKQLPWEMKMNEMASMRQTGFQNMWSGLEGMAATAMDFAGTKYAIDAYTNMPIPNMPMSNMSISNRPIPNVYGIGGRGRAPQMPLPQIGNPRWGLGSINTGTY